MSVHEHSQSSDWESASDASSSESASSEGTPRRRPRARARRPAGGGRRQDQRRADRERQRELDLRNPAIIGVGSWSAAVKEFVNDPAYVHEVSKYIGSASVFKQHYNQFVRAVNNASNDDGSGPRAGGRWIYLRDQDGLPLSNSERLRFFLYNILLFAGDGRHAPGQVDFNASVSFLLSVK